MPFEKSNATNFGNQKYHLSNQNLLQSAYKQFHGTETALVKVFNDIILDVDRNRTVILLLLDLSAAFDAVDHTILIER